MKLHHLLLNAAKPRLLIINLLWAVIGFCAPTLAAQQQTLHVAPDHSTARLFIGTRENPKAFNVAVERVSGEINIDNDNLNASSVNVRIYAANESAASDSDSQALAGIQPVFSFRSQRVTDGGDGMLRVDGLLTVTQAEHDAVVSTGEDYSGPVYGPARLVHASHAATFTFSRLALKSSSDSSGPSGEAKLLKTQHVFLEPAVLFTASTSINGESFPELLVSARDTTWPLAVNDVECSIPSTVGEDYSGPQCSGSVVAPFSSPVLQVQIGEDYSGIQVEMPRGKQITIDLALVLTGAGNVASRQGQPSVLGKDSNKSVQTAQGH